MDYTCFQEMPLPLPMDDRGMSTMDASNSGAPVHLQGSLRSQQQQQHQQLNSTHFSNQFTYPVASWSTTYPTLLLAQSQQQNLQEQLQHRGSTKGGVCLPSVKSHGDSSSSNPDTASAYADPYIDSCGFPSMPSFDYSGGNGGQYLQNVGLIDSDTDNLINLPLDTLGGFYNCSDAANERILNNAGDLYGLGGGGAGCGGFNMDSSSLAPLPWSQQSCSLLSSEQFCSDGLMPPLVSDYYSQSSELQHQPTYCNNSSASVECGGGIHEADSCGNSERDKSTASDEISWANSAINHSDQAIIQPLHSVDSLLRRSAERSNTGAMLPSSVRRRVLNDEYSSTMVATMRDNAEFGSTQTHITASRTARLPQHHRSSDCNTGGMAPVTNKFSGTSTVRTPPVERVSWMAPVSSTNSQVEGKSYLPTLDQLLGTSSAGQLTSAVGNGGNSNDGLRLLPTSPSPYNYGRQPRACYTLESIPLSANSRPLSTAPSQTGRMNSGYPMAPLMEQSTANEGGGSSNLYRELLGGFTRAPMGGAGPSQAPKPVLATAHENSARGFGFRRDYACGSDHPLLASPSRKQPATSIEPQSVAARHRRKKISERVRLLEKLIPGGSKMDTASMFDEAIEYVKFLQLQVQLLEGMGEGDKSGMEIDAQQGSQAGTGSAAAEGSTSSVMTSATMSCAAASSSGSHALVNSSYNNGNSGNSRVGNNAHATSGSTSGGLGSSALSAALQQSTFKSTTATAAVPNNSPLILSEVLQDQLFKQKLCLVSLQQYHICPQQQASQQPPVLPSTRHANR